MARVNRKSTNPGLVVAYLLGVMGIAWSGYTFFIHPLFHPPFQYAAIEQGVVDGENKPVPIKPLVTHLSTPASVKAVYMTSWVAGTPRIRNRLINLIDTTELNSVVIDVKDYSGRIVFPVSDPELTATGAVEVRISDIQGLIADLHQRGIYVIGRVSVFQDAYFVSQHPELAIHRRSDGGIWKDRKGISWLEAGSVPVWNYVLKIARAAYAVGFDEINFDYIRFPSDGNMQDISYQYFDPTRETRAQVMKRFYAYLSQGLASLKMPISIDLFGLTTTSLDDLGIGQVLVDAAPYFDYIAPMVYPSHFASGYLNFSNPTTHPYEVVKNVMTKAGERLVVASSTTSKLRPWLQDFNLGAIYTADMVRAQIQATYDSGLTSWMLWDPNNQYTPEALDK